MGDTPTPTPLLAAYLERRDDLKRYFTLRLGSAEAAEDLVQDIYFKVAAGETGDIANPAAFLFRLGTNLMLDRLKQQRRAKSRDGGWAEVQSNSLGGEEVADAPAVDEALAARQQLERMLAALEELPPACAPRLPAAQAGGLQPRRDCRRHGRVKKHHRETYQRGFETSVEEA